MLPKQLLSDDVLSQLSDTQLKQLWSVFVVDTSPFVDLDIPTAHDLNPRTGYVVVSELQGKSRSRKLGNITLNWGHLVETMPDILISGMSAATVAAAPSPLTIMIVALGICNGLWKGRPGGTD